MPSPSANTAQVLLLAPSDAVLAASDDVDRQEDDILVSPGGSPRRSGAVALLLSLLLHAAIGVTLWQWTAEIAPTPDSPVLQVRLRAGGSVSAPPVAMDLPPAPPAPVAAVPEPRRPAAPVPALQPFEPAKTAILPTAPPVVASQEIEPAPPTAAAAERNGTEVITPPVDPLVNSATLHVLEWLGQHRRYPAPARRARLQGTVEIIVVLMPDGRLVGQRISQSSGHALLDKAALELLRRASPVPTSAFFTGEARQLELRLPIIYRLSI